MSAENNGEAVKAAIANNEKSFTTRILQNPGNFACYNFVTNEIGTTESAGSGRDRLTAGQPEG